MLKVKKIYRAKGFKTKCSICNEFLQTRAVLVRGYNDNHSPKTMNRKAHVLYCPTCQEHFVNQSNEHIFERDMFPYSFFPSNINQLVEKQKNFTEQIFSQQKRVEPYKSPYYIDTTSGFIFKR
ncbi:MAG: hypothetical protein JJT76_18745 [Clostridiaceae bacterium]|nr:hypothetical protein [Clostridiaceae bacterium]